MTGKAKILLVENETPTAMMVVSLLTQVGCDVQVATKGQKGMEIAQEQPFDLIILEIDLKDINGLKICAELKQRHLTYRTPVVFLSKQRGEEHREAALGLGAVDFIERPFGASDFVSRVLSHLQTEEEMSC